MSPWKCFSLSSIGFISAEEVAFSHWKHFFSHTFAFKGIIHIGEKIYPLTQDVSIESDDCEDIVERKRCSIESEDNFLEINDISIER